MDLSRNISLYNGARDNVGVPVAIQDVISRITGDAALHQQIDALRGAADEDAQDKLKSRLHAVTWSGLFERRDGTKLQQFSGLICIDIDRMVPLLDDKGKVVKYKAENGKMKIRKVPQFDMAEFTEIKARLFADPHLFFGFISPRGEGLKLVFRIEKHDLPTFETIQLYILQTYGLKIDPSGKDVNRLCFLSHDPDAYFNTDASIFEVKPEEKRPEKKQRTRKSTESGKTETLDDVAAFTNQKMEFYDGNRNNWIHLFANNANRKGFSESETLDYILSNYKDDLHETDIKATVHSAFKNVDERGKYKRQATLHLEGGNLSVGIPDEGAAEEDQREITIEEFQEKYQFFDIRWTVDKSGDEGETKRRQRGFKINGIRFLAILDDLGFRRMDIDKGHFFVRLVNNVIEEVDDVFIQDTFKKHLEKMPEIIHLDDALLHRSAIINFMIDVHAKLFNKDVLNFLPLINTKNINEDTESASFFYYKNKCVKITADKVEVMSYSDLGEKYVWKENILDRKIKLLGFTEDQDNNVWAQFLWHVCDDDLERLKALMRIIGYLMHQYFGGKQKAIVFTDSRISDEPMGRSGKSLIFKGIRHMLNSDGNSNKGIACTIDAKQYNLEKEGGTQKMYQQCNINTKVIHINDVKPNYNVEYHYNEIEEGITIKKLYLEPFTILVKILISTNRTLKLSGDSSLDRYIVFDLSSHYSKEWTPEKEFGKWFFRDFTEHEWNLFDSFMLYCVQDYLKGGLITYKNINLEKRMLHEQVGEELLKFLDDFPNDRFNITWTETGIIPKRKYEKRQMYDLFIELTHSDSKRYNQRMFTKRLRQYKHLSDKWKSDHQDSNGNYFQESRSNGRDYIEFIPIEP